MDKSTLSYVRKDMLPEQTPPLAQAGGHRWVRDNLFSGWLNTILTLASIYVVYAAIMAIGPWLMNSVWNAESLTECREILDGTAGACWGVIKARWHQLLFGFYPEELYWRPVLTLILLFVSLAPVLFPNVPRKLLYLSAAFPFIGFHLLWGGSIWLPITAAAGFVVGFFAYRFAKVVSPLIGVGAAIIAPVLWWLIVAGPLTEALASILPIGLEAVRSDRFGGFMISLIIGFSGISLSLPIGILLALGRQSDMIFVKSVCVMFIEFIRGVPLITLLFTASLLLNYFLPPGTSFDLILRVIIMVTVFASAYMAEVVRGGLAALPNGQYEAADALGLDYWKAQRLIIMPQALKISIPGIVNTFIGLFKDTTLVVFIGLLDPIGLSNAIRADSNWQGIYWELFIFIGALFFIFCFGMSRYSMSLERRLKTDHR
ncbi:general L-amino acid transport system permease protein [Roseicitreum antarcticum]|uniref:General L-amino acid transport system permease protein n=2 Tax=Roseicitreum antarcticum TaxID=564137 RepID=A0A1H3ARZ1_9RHOB|nr:amino acid ABC transporter permease [Roseicitreum antarcticum]SDX32168.1 general L-amino acid transport system permease protein [Roseicitreum antarcticum]